MTGLVPLLLVLVDPPLASDGERFLQAKGRMTVRCQTRWHNLDLTVTAQHGSRVREAGVYGFRPARLVDGHAWQVEAADVTALAKLLHQVPWVADDKDAEKYALWHGSMIQRQSLTAEGNLKLKLSKSTTGFQAEFAGTVRVKDSGWLGNRFGPNGWEKTWTHKLSGTVHSSKTGQVSLVELTDEFEVSGGFTNQPGVISDPASQKGSLTVRLILPKPLSTEEARQIEKLVAQLGAKRFEDWENASKELSNMGPRIAGLLRELAPGYKDPELRKRIETILQAIP